MSQTQSVTPQPTHKSGYIPSIDGLRAIAVVAVILYHLNITWIPGGFLGVDLFFCISGYVITRQLLDSVAAKGGLDLREFYIARARRLIPALFFMLIGTSIIIALWAPDSVHRFVADLPYVLTGTENWHLVAIHQDYFSSIGRAPLLQHTWSLAVEAQFYLIWPLIILLVLKYFGKARVAVASLIIAASSGIALFIFSLSLDSHGSAVIADRIGHIYFGTDTHSLGLFLGATLAVSWVPANLHKEISQRAQDFIDGIGVIGLLGLLATFLFINENNSAQYQLAFPLAAIFGCATIVSLVHPASRFAPLIGSKPLLWIGQRSYAIYLWHWVIFQVTRPTADLAGKIWAIDIARVLLVIALADISLRFIEVPIRRGALANWIRGRRYRRKSVQRRERALLTTTPLVLVGLVIAGSLVAEHRDHSNLINNLATEQTVSSYSGNKSVSGLWVTGDSIILGSKTKLAARYTLAEINARVGRQIGELIQVVEQDKTGLEHDPVVLDLGNNNHLTSDDVTTLFNLLKDQPKMVVVNTAVPRTYRLDNDRIIKQVIASYPNATLVDWNAISNGHPEYFGPDGVHLSDQGSTVYVDAIISALISQ
jgi:peptidoglycan/LPS O-acetylase OafA/YrhL